jgi:hypothetical protein
MNVSWADAVSMTREIVLTNHMQENMCCKKARFAEATGVGNLLNKTCLKKL